MRRIFLDHNATSPLSPEVREAMICAMQSGNPSSVHSEGRAAHNLLETSRRTLEAELNVARGGVIFTSGGTEAVNLALRGLVTRDMSFGSQTPSKVKRLFICATEHAAVHACASSLTVQFGVCVEMIPVLPSGEVDFDWLSARLTAYDPVGEGGFMVAIMLANNETGIIHQFDAIKPLIRAKKGYLFVDAVQALGKIAVDFTALGADLMAISAHKIRGPKGVGALLVKPGIVLNAVNNGGGQELRRRGGTENLIGIAGFAAAITMMDLAGMRDLAMYRDALEAGLKAQNIPGLRIWGEMAERLPNTLCYSTPGFKSQTQVMTLDLAGFAVSAGAACSSGKVLPSPVLTAMGASPREAESCLRVSLGHGNASNDVSEFLSAWRAAYKRAQAAKAA